MTIQDIYNLAIQMGIDADLRGREAVEKFLQRKKEKQEPDQDQDAWHNPYLDSRIYHIAQDKEIKKVLVGIDIEPAEILIAKELGDIDLIIAHHPLGKGLANLHEVMNMQCEIFNLYGVPINVAEGLMREKISEVARGVNKVNHQRTVDAAKLLGFNLMNVHTPADNLVAKFLKDKIDSVQPERLDDLIKLLKEIPEYAEAMKIGAGPKIFVGSPERRCGKIALTELTGGTEGSPKLYEKMAQVGIGTIVGMHVSEEHKKEAELANLNIVIAGHISSDSIGMNLFLDELEKQGIEIVPCSGLIRVKRQICQTVAMENNPKKICFVGAPSTGKSTSARHLTEALMGKNHSAEFVAEFARDYIIEHGTVRGPADQLDIVKGQREREEKALGRNPKFVVCDCATFLSPVYFHFLHDSLADKNEEEMNKIEKEIWHEIGGQINTYDYVFFLPPEFKPELDGTRLYTDKADDISNRIKNFLLEHKIAHHELRGSVEERTNQAFKIINFSDK